MTATPTAYPKKPKLVIGLNYEPIRIVLMEVTEDCPEPFLVDHHFCRTLEALQTYLWRAKEAATASVLVD